MSAGGAMWGRTLRRAVVTAGMAGAVAGFYLPWVRLDIHESGALQRAAALGRGRVMVTIRRGTETVTGELPTLAALPRQISGADIPRLVRQQDTQAAIALVEALTQTRRHLALQSLLVYLLPGVALLCGALLLAFDGRRSVIAAAGLCCAAVAAAGWWKLLTVVPDRAVLTVTIGPGLWVSLGSYAGLALAAGWALAAGSPRLH